MAESDEVETVDAELVVAEALPRAEVEPVRRVLPPVAVAAGAAVTGMAAGVVTVAAVRRRSVRKASKRRRKALGQVVASRSFLVDVHVLDR